MEKLERKVKKSSSSKRKLPEIRNGWGHVGGTKSEGNGVPIKEPTTQYFK